MADDKSQPSVLQAHNLERQDEHHQPVQEQVNTAPLDEGWKTGSVITDISCESECTNRVRDVPFVLENGRRYHDPLQYPLPDDKREQKRLDMQHKQCLFSHDGRLVLCPRQSFSNVLDLGTGTGVWAIDFADAHPEASVTGVDLSPIQPAWVPQNCQFELGNVEEEWTWHKKFDLIHARMLSGSFRDPASVAREAFNHLLPGGYLEIQNMLWIPQSDDGTLNEDSPLLRWANLLHEAADNVGRPMIRLASEYRTMLSDAGFEDIHVSAKRWPTNTWPRDQTLNKIAAFNDRTLGQELASISMARFTYGLGWAPEEVRVMCAFARGDFRNPKVHAYFPFVTVYGRKPTYNSRRPASQPTI